MSNMTSKLVNSVRQAKDKKPGEDDSAKSPEKGAPSQTKTQAQTKAKAKPATKKAKTKAATSTRAKTSTSRAKTSTRRKTQAKKLNATDPFSFERVWPD